VPLTLVTGPANAAKAGRVLGALRERLDEEPILVVPAFADVEHNQRELAERGAVFGARVLRFRLLFRTIADRVGYSARIASELQRTLIVQRAIERAGLRVLSQSAEHPGFARAAARLVEELGREMVGPDALGRALSAWAGGGPRRGYAAEVAAIHRGYHDGLEAAGLVDRELFAWRALDALRREPARWRGTAVFVYGFDDFTRLELDALETLARHCEADVTVSLPFEPGREAFKAVAGVHEELRVLAGDEIQLDPVSTHYADESRPALHHLERSLFSSDPRAPVPAGDAVRLHAAGGERAEVELVAASVLELLRAGTEPGDVAVVFRDPDRYSSLLEQVFGAYGIPHSLDLSLPLRRTGLGRGLLALIRCAVLGGSADDLLTYLRTPGRLREAATADRLEAEVRREGAESASRAREIWEDRGWGPLGELDRLAGARDMTGFLEELARALERLFTEPYRRRAPVLQGAELDDAGVFRAAHSALRELHALLEADPTLELDAERVHELLAGLGVQVGENPQPDRVQVAEPGDIRARRFQAVFVCGLQEGEFPRRESPEPFLPDEERRALAEHGVRLPAKEDQLDRERYLLYVCASRAERLLVLSFRYCDEEGDPSARSFFVDDVAEVFEELPRRRRSLSDVTWAPEEAPTVAEWERAVALSGPRIEQAEPAPLSAPELLEFLAAKEALSAGALERYADCPVKWLVEDLLDPLALEPDPEQMVRGSYAHEVLRATYERLREETGTRRVRPAVLADAERIVLEELRRLRGEFALSPRRTRVRAAARRLEFDLLRFLRHEAEDDTRFEPEALELQFGPLELEDGLRVRGRIDRVDTWDGYALVRDYKSGRSVASYKVASWEPENRFQVALYMLAAARLLEREPAGGVYVPLGGDDRRPRGMLASEVDALGSGFQSNDRLPPERFEERLEWARTAIRDTAARMRAGKLRSCPDDCAWNGGCSYPSICRAEE
jgi:ATP-dependent helicase/DNAse subunit B